MNIYNFFCLAACLDLLMRMSPKHAAYRAIARLTACVKSCQ